MNSRIVKICLIFLASVAVSSFAMGQATAQNTKVNPSGPKIPGLVDGSMPHIVSLATTGRFAPKMKVGVHQVYMDYLNGRGVPCECVQLVLGKDTSGYDSDDTAFGVIDLLKRWIQPNPAHKIDYLGVDGKPHNLWVEVSNALNDNRNANFRMDDGYKTGHVDFCGVDGHKYTITVRIINYIWGSPSASPRPGQSAEPGDPSWFAGHAAGGTQSIPLGSSSWPTAAQIVFDVQPYTGPTNG